MDYFGTVSTGCFLFAEANSRKEGYSQQKVSMELIVGHSDRVNSDVVSGFCTHVLTYGLADAPLVT